MKNFFTLIMATVVSLSMFAITPAELEKKEDPTGHATKLVEKRLQHKQDVAKVLQMNRLERKAMPKATAETKQLPASVAPKAKAQNEVITLNYDAFAGMTCYEEEGEWWIGLSCDDWSRNEYGHNLNLEWFAPADNPCGTFTTDDFSYDYTHLTTPFSYGSIHFTDITMTLTSEKVSANLERYVLNATLVGEDGYTYEVHAVHENIIAKGEESSMILDATIAISDWDFTLTGKNDDLDIQLVINNSDVIGSYGRNMVDWENSHITYKGAALTPLTFKATVNLATHTEDGSLAYLTDIQMMGNDTINYHFVVAAPLPAPSDTIELTANDLTVDDSWAAMFGMVDFYANTSDFAIRGGWQAGIAEEGTYEAAIFLDDVNMNTITSLQAEVEVSTDDSGHWAIEGTMLGNDNKVYNLHLKWFVPEQTDTVLVAFENSAKAKYYPHLDDDIQLYNENDRFSASINVANVALGEDFDQESMNSYFSYLEIKDGTPLTIAEVINGKLYQVGDTTKIEADYVTFEGVLYQVRLWYVAPTPTETVNLHIEDAEFILDFDYNGVYNLVGYTDDMQTAVVFTVYATAKEDIPGTFVNDGKFGEFGEGQYEFDASNSYIGKWNADMEMYELYYVQKGQVVVALDENDNITLTASVVAEDAIQYEVEMTSKYEKPHLEYDSESDPVNRIYDASATLTITDYTFDNFLISALIIDEVVGDVTALYFMMSEPGKDHLLPAGTYPINDSWFDYTVLASTGIEWDGSVMPSYYAGYTDGWLVEPFYFFVSGEVVVSYVGDNIRIEINALNSCDIPVHIVYDGNGGTGVENVSGESAAAKRIANGQLLIIRDGKTYNALGVQIQ